MEYTMESTREQQEPPLSLLVSVLEAARLLSLSERTMRTHVSNNTVPSVKVGGRRLILRDDLHAFVRQMAATQYRAATPAYRE